MFISRFNFNSEKGKSYASGFNAGYIRGREEGVKQEREDGLFRKYTPNEIRKILGFPPVKDGYEIFFSAVDEIDAAKDRATPDRTSIDREKYIEALKDVCKDCNGCENCPIGRIEHNQKYCIDHNWEEMDDYALKTLAGAAGIVFEEDEEIVEDPVNRPSHYTSGGIECIDALEASMTPIEYAGFLKGQVFKYIWRYRLKGKPVEDLKKARYYLDHLIQIIEREEAAT